MKRILPSILLLLGVVLVRPTAQAQSTYILQIDSVVALPDSIVDGSTVTFFMQVSLNSPLFYQGNVFVEFEYGGSFYQADSTISQNFLTPNAPNQIQVFHRFSTEDDLNIGDNVVVVWPRIGNGSDPPQTVINPYEATITLIQPTSVSESPDLRNDIAFTYPNPAENLLHFMVPSETSATVRIIDMRGAIVAQTNAMQLDISRLPNALYLVEMSTDDGRHFYQKLLVAR